MRACINEALFLRILLHNDDLRVIAELDAVRPRSVKVGVGAFRFRGFLRSVFLALVFRVCDVRFGKFHQRIWKLAPVLELENHGITLQTNHPGLHLPILNVCPEPHFR